MTTTVFRRLRALRAAACALAACALATGCATTTDELLGLAGRPPLDRAVLVSGGAFYASGGSALGTFGGGVGGAQEGVEALAFGEIVAALDHLEGHMSEQGWVFGSFTLADLSIASPFINAAYAGYEVDDSRWPALAALISEHIGEGWITDLTQLKRLAPLADDPALQQRWQSIPRIC